MKIARSLLSLATLLGVACNSPDVANDGAYKFLSGAPGTDTSPHPLSILLIIEEDAEAARTLFYLFEGELGRADLGIPDLRRVSFGFGYADARFDFPLSHFDFGANGPAGEGGAGGASVQAPQPVRTLSVDGHTVDLFEVDDASAFDLGATRYLGAIRSTDYRLRVYWGSLDTAIGVGAVHWESGSSRLRHTAEVSPTRVRFGESVDEELRVEHGRLPGADYKVVDLYQRIVRKNDAVEIDALVRTPYAIDTDYVAAAVLIASVGRGLCWTLERPLFVRVEQVARRYHFGQGAADYAVIHRRRDFARVPEAAWQDDAPTGDLPGYCNEYE